MASRTRRPVLVGGEIGRRQLDLGAGHRPHYVLSRKLGPMDRPAPDPTKLLEAWMEWERGETPPGRVMATLKTGGLRLLLEDLVAAAPKAAPGEGGTAAEEAWTPVV